MADTIVWLYCMWRVRRRYRALVFSKRKRFLSDLQPWANSDNTIAYPDAIFYVQPKDVDRAINLTKAL